ncbi:hypothetical protein Tco_0701904 [Tanacetum coccineum]|uniref:Xylulose kinase-1 n=1 Tax=Tanacetum coccineum TaxID=301880 RepID=A0ABQ4XWG5_9ASTR
MMNINQDYPTSSRTPPYFDSNGGGDGGLKGGLDQRAKVRPTCIKVRSTSGVNALVAFLEKPTESEGFEEIVGFMNANPIKYALTINLTVYCSCIKQFWDTVKVKTVNGEVQLQALVDKKKVIITESTIRRDLQLEDAEEHLADEVANEEHVPTQSNDPPLSRVNTLRSGEDKLSLKELMDLCTKLSDRVLDLETTKTAQAKEIASLKKRVKKLEGKRKSKPLGMKRLFNIGRSAQVVSSKDEGLGDQEDASKQGRKIADIDADAEEVSTAEVAIDSATTTTVVELTLTQTLIEIKAAKPKDKGKAKIIEPEKPLKKKDQIMYDQEVVVNLQAQLQAEFEEEERLARQKEEEANID